MTADLATLRALKKRVEAASGPDRELDEATAIWSGMKATLRVGHECLGTDRVVPVRSPAYTASIDAALALVERLGEDPERILDNAMEDLTKYGWRGSKWLPMLPIFIIYSLLSALISRAEEARQS